MDPAGLAGRHPRPRTRLCAGGWPGPQRETRAAGAGRGSGRECVGALRRGRGQGAGPHRRARARRLCARSSVLRARDPAASRRARHRRGRHRSRAHRPRPRPGGLRGGQALRPYRALSRSADQPGGRQGSLPAGHPADPHARGRDRDRRRASVEGERSDRRGAGRSRRAAGLGQAAAQLSALLAPQDAGGLPCHPAVVHLDDAGEPARRRAGCDQGRAVVSRLGRGAYPCHGRGSPRLVHLASAHLGRADRAVHPPPYRRAAPAQRRADASGG
ncbi:MAG: hypothetical protein KatS3mg127_0904 [Silanimonas sp.]|nr:MAG: hypothetical protein KatS3mg127_0904 [Silanimonas sp.]